MTTEFDGEPQNYKQRSHQEVDDLQGGVKNVKSHEGESHQPLPVLPLDNDTDVLPQSVSRSPSEIQSTPSSVQKRNSSFIQWFCNLPLGRKQLIALIAAELVSIVGLSAGARWIITTGLRTQLLDRSKAEVTATESNINLKVNQTGLGFRSQSDNAAIIEAARVYERSRNLPPALKDQVKQILQNETKARSIEFATLVGKDFKIILNAKANREGQTFNPNNLVRDVFDSSKQIKANAFISSEDLSRESPLPPGYTVRDALIRYTVTPVFDPSTKKAIAALVSGDIVNGKLPIMTGILKDFKGGYSAIYLRKPTGEFALATSLDQGKAAEPGQAQPNVALSDTSLLAAAAAAPDGQVVTGRMAVGTQTYTMTAKAIPNLILQGENGPVPVFSDQPVTILVRGTPETTLNNLLRQSWLQEGVVLLLALLVTGILVLILRRTITQPLEQLGRANQKFAEGDRASRAEVSSMDEVGQLAVTFNKMADSIVASEATLSEQAHRQKVEAERTQLFTDITLRIRRSLNLEDILRTAVKETRKALYTERVVIYRFDSAREGTVVAESVAPGWTQVFEEDINDPCFRELYLNERDTRVRAIDNIYQAGLTADRIKQLKQFEVKASLVVPIVTTNQLFGLLIAHQCSEPRAWQQSEIDLFAQVATQVGVAITQANLLDQLEQARSRAELVSQDQRQQSQEQRQQKEAIQRQVLGLLNDIEGASSGDLTVRAEVTAGEIGTVADFFNAIVESLRQIVTSVKKATGQVNTSLGENSGAISQLADEAFKQAEDINRTLDSVEQMTRSIQAVANSANQAAVVARTASTTAEVGGEAMDRTVESILNLRETVAETANKVKRLGESSQEISKVVFLINQITLQTNLLSINASIEAARAGEQGQGFAVVAQQVGQLAAQAGAATKEIEQLVENIQQETSEVVRAMELGTTQVIEGTHLVTDTKKSLEQILDVSHQIDQLVQSISSATVSQAETSQAVTSLMKEIAKVSERTSNSSGQVSVSLQQTVEVAKQLQASVGTFKVGAET